MSANHMKERQLDIDTIKKDIKVDSDKASQMSRFGYFSINYPAFIGDGYYSNAKKKHTNEQNKVITDPRNIATNPTKTDKYPTSFFSNDFREEPKRLDQLRELEDKFQAEKIAKVKYKKSDEYKKKNFRRNFIPSGPKEYVDLYDQNKVEYKQQIYKEKNRFLRIDKEKHKVFTDPRNIVTNPMKRGTSSYPNILFSFKTLGPIEYKKRPQSAKKIIKKGDKKEFKNPFKPASLKKNETFTNIIQQYGENPKTIEELVEAHSNKNKAHGRRYKKILPEGSVKHLRGFKPPKMEQMGVNLFSKYEEPILPKLEEKKVIKKKGEKGEYKSAFKPNKLVDNSQFSAAISSFSSNLKKEFPMAFHKY